MPEPAVRSEPADERTPGSEDVAPIGAHTPAKGGTASVAEPSPDRGDASSIEDAAPARRPDDVGGAGAVALIALLSMLLALWGSFLVPLRVAGVLVPVSWLIAVVGNLFTTRTAGRAAGRPGAAVPAVLWLGIVFALGMRRSEGDLVIPGTLTGSVFLLAGSLAAAVGFALAPRTPGHARPSREHRGEH